MLIFVLNVIFCKLGKLCLYMSTGFYNTERTHFAGNNEIAVTVEQTSNNVFQPLKIAGTLFLHQRMCSQTGTHTWHSSLLCILSRSGHWINTQGLLDDLRKGQRSRQTLFSSKSPGHLRT